MSLRVKGLFCLLMAAGFGPAALLRAQTAAPAVAAPPTVIGYTAVDAKARWKWLFVENLGIGSVLDDIAVGGVDTFFNTPKEYGPHWGGFGERIGMVTANYALKSTLEAGLGSFWGEDPRYFRTDGLPFKSRVVYVIKMTFVARNQAGGYMPAYSRFVAFPASSFISNAWQPPSQDKASDAAIRVGLGFLSRMGENAWKEFIVPKKK
jgi:hypothetical protein